MRRLRHFTRRGCQVAALLLVPVMISCSDDSTPLVDGLIQHDSQITDGPGPGVDQGPGMDQGPGVDQGKQPDGSVQKDMGTQADKAVAKDAAAGISCGAIGTCSDKCAAACPGGLAKFACLIKCSNDCKAKGCASAKTLFGVLYSCINKQCLTACLGGPTAGCKTCTTTKCKVETDKCNAHKC